MYNQLSQRLVLLPVVSLLAGFIFQFSEIPSEARIYPSILLIVSGFLIIFLIFSKSPKVFNEEVVHNTKQDIAVKRETKDIPLNANTKIKRVAENVTIQLCIFCMLVLLYMWFIIKISYILATVSFIFVALFMLRVRSIFLLILFPVITTMSLYLFFSRVLRVILPQGEWFIIYL